MRIVDFIEQYREYNLGRRFPKGTQVLFELPKSDQFSQNKEKVTTALGWIFSHDETGYDIFYDNEFIHVPYESVMTSKAEIDRCPVCDSLLNSMSFSNGDNFNELAKKLTFSFGNIDSESVIDLCSDLQARVSSLKDGQELQVFVFDSEFIDQNIDSDIVDVDSLELLGKYGDCYVYFTVFSYDE